MPVRYQGRLLPLQGIRTSERENAPAFGFSIMVTGTFGVLSALDSPPAVWEVFLFATGAVGGFTLLLVASTLGLQERSADGRRVDVLYVTALLNLVSVLTAIATAALVGWLVGGWVAWFAGPLGASAVYAVVNGLEYALAEEEEGGG